MKAMDYWQLFLETGAPEAYLMFNQQRKMEDGYVLDGSGGCPESYRLQ